MLTALSYVCVTSGALLVVLVLVHKGSGEGLTDMVGGGGGDNLAARTGKASRNLMAATLLVLAVWVASVVAIGLMSA